MPFVDSSCRLDNVEHIEASGTGTLDFAVSGENVPLTWDGVEDADWTVEGVDRIENVEEDRFVIYPEGDYFVCEIEADGAEANNGPVRCWSKSTTR